jgi:hypothetical protein
LVCVALQVSIVAVPEVAGVHSKTRSGELPEMAQVPARVLGPLVVPVRTPPLAGMTLALAHWLTVDDVVLDVVVTVVLDVVVTVVLDVVGTDVLDVVGTDVLDVVGTDVLVVVGPGGAGATIVSWKLPLRPFQPSTTMKYVCPAVTVGVIREACWPAFGVPSPVAHPAVSSLQAICVPVQVSWRM